jgi:hypothetical protein
MKIKLVFLMVLSLLNIQSVLVAQDEKVRFQRVDQDRLKRAMDTASKSAYDPMVTTNGIRYQTDVIIDLLEHGASKDHGQSEEACLLFIGYKDWFEAFRSVNFPNQDAPEYVKKAYQFKQNIVIDPNLRKEITENNLNGIPDIAANVALYWESGHKSFSYEDEYSDPKLEVINEKNIIYRLLKYKDDNLIVCDQIEGFKGRALSGFLRILGKARMTQYRIVPAEDGAQYVLMETKKWFFTWKNYLKIETNGVTTDGVSDEKAKQTLHREIKIQYEHETLKMDRLHIPSDKLAKLDCNNGNS